MQQEAVIEFLRGNDLKLSGGGQCDSPGYSAKYYTYSLMDPATSVGRYTENTVYRGIEINTASVFVNTEIP